MGYFGMAMSDGQIQLSHPGKLYKQDDLPLNITKIDVFFMISEQQIHSMVFYGDTIL